MTTTNNGNEQQPTAQQEQKPLTAKEITRRMIEAAKAKNSGKLGGGPYDKRKFRRL